MNRELILEVCKAWGACRNRRVGLLIDFLETLFGMVELEVFHESETDIGWVKQYIRFLLWEVEYFWGGWSISGLLLSGCCLGISSNDLKFI
jgi:hypothetical protein